MTGGESLNKEIIERRNVDGVTIEKVLIRSIAAFKLASYRKYKYSHGVLRLADFKCSTLCVIKRYPTFHIVGIILKKKVRNLDKFWFLVETQIIFNRS